MGSKVKISGKVAAIVEQRLEGPTIEARHQSYSLVLRLIKGVFGSAVIEAWAKVKGVGAAKVHHIKDRAKASLDIPVLGEEAWLNVEVHRYQEDVRRGQLDRVGVNAGACRHLMLAYNCIKLANIEAWHSTSKCRASLEVVHITITEAAPYK
jgi:hypothetical protein